MTLYMNKYIATSIGAALLLSACGAIESGNVGVRTSFTGSVNTTEMQQGFYTHITSDVQQFSTKEITVGLMDMQPKAKDNLTLADLDLEVYYTIDPSKVSEIKIKYSGRDRKTGGIWYPAYDLVRSVARAASYDAISEYDSLTIHTQRDKIKEQIRVSTQRVLDKTDPGIFQITKVIIRDVKTDPSIEQSIKLAVARNKELEAKSIELEIARKQVEINEALTLSLTPEILEQKRLEVIETACAAGTCILSMGDTSATPVYNVNRKR